MIIRRRYTANFTTIANVLFEDERLTLDELGLLAWLRSRPHDWQVRRPALMRRFKVGRDGMRRIMRALLRCGWMMAQVTRLPDGRVHVIYEVRDEPGPELSEDEARAALSLVSSGAGLGDSPENDGQDEGSEEQPDADPGGGSPPTGQPEAASRLRLSPPGYIEESLKTDSVRTESQNGVRAFSAVKTQWPAEHVLSAVTAERAYLGLTDTDKVECDRGIKPYLSDCANQGRKVCDLRTFIDQRRWERFKQAGKKGPAVFKIRSAQWYRWREYKVAAGQPVKFMDHYANNNPNGTWSEPDEWPPPMPAKPVSGPAVKEDMPALSEQEIRDFVEQ